MKTLLSGDQDAPTSLLSDCPDEEESEFSRLISRSTPTTAHHIQHPRRSGSSVSWADGEIVGGQQYEENDHHPPSSYLRRKKRRHQRQLLSHHHYHRQQQHDANGQNEETGLCSATFVIIAAGACWIMQISFCFASFLSNSWTATLVELTAGDPSYSSSFGKSTTPIRLVLPPLATTSPATLWQSLNNNVSIALLLMTTTLVLPCLNMVLTPAEIVQAWSSTTTTIDTTATATYSRSIYYSGTLDKRSVVSWTQQYWLPLAHRWTVCLVYVMLILSVAVQFVSIKWTDAVLSVHSQLSAGLAAFALGSSSAVFSAMILRLQNDHVFHENPNNTMNVSTLSQRSLNDNDVGNQIETERVDSSSSAAIPQQSDDGTLSSVSNIELDDTGTATGMRILEDEVEPKETNTLQNNTALDDENNGSATQLEPLLPGSRSNSGSFHSAPTKRRPFWQVLVVFQFGLCSILLSVPALTLPLIRFEYTGFVSELLNGHSTQSVSLSDLPGIIYHDGVHANTPPWISWIVGVLIFLNIVGCPLLATILSFTTWFLPPDANCRQQSRHFCRRWLFAVHPGVGGIALVATLCIASPTVEALCDNMFNKNLSDRGICDIVSSFSGGNCLTVRSTAMQGFWYYAAQTMCLEMFIVLTIRWS